MASNSSNCLLDNLLDSTPYALAYALPLLLISLVLTFAGTFLILDRTRGFSPRRNVVHALYRKSSMRWLYMLEGGVGGIAAGYAFAIHLATFLALLIPVTTASAALSPKSFLAVWLLSALSCMFLGGRWKHAALALASISGYSTFGVACAVMIHPSLLARIVLVSIFTPIGLILCLLPSAKYRHAFLRFATSSAGAFGAVLSIATLASIPVWREVWSRLWIADANGWGSSIEKGLSTVYCLLLLGGCASDWFLHRKLGENPDEKWDSYLSDYVSTLPNEAGRAGTFEPLSSLWARISGHRHIDDAHAEIIYPTDADLKRPIPSLYELPRQQSLATVTSPTEPQFHRGPTFLRKHGKKGVRGFRRTRDAVKFSPLNVDDLSFSSDDESDDGVLTPPIKSLAVRRKQSLSRNSSITLGNEDRLLVSGDKGVQKGQSRLAEARSANIPDYSDFEEDVAISASPRPSGLNGEPWQPGFIRRQSLKPTSTTTSVTSVPPSSQRIAVETTPSLTLLASPVPSFTAVPATPSLVRAIERVQTAYTPGLSSSVPTGTQASGEPKGPRWNSFWQEVKAKAGHELVHHHTPGMLS